MPTLAESVARSLPTRPVGRTDLHITRAGFGAWAIGGGVDAASLELSNEDLHEIAAALARTGAGTGPLFPVHNTSGRAHG